MRRLYLVLPCSFFGILLIGAAVPSRGNGQGEAPAGALVYSLRLLNTAEAAYLNENGRFASREEILTFLRKREFGKPPAIDLENPKPYELSITTTQDGRHYQITLKRPSDMYDKSTWCKTAVFSDDAGVIFLGSAIDCEAPTR